ncbi:MAG: response regulator, partial [Proteobacteria bacterium]
MSNPPSPVILVVDDTPDNLVLASELLSPRYTVMVANSGVSALRLARQEPIPSLVLLDIRMPEMDGYEVCRQLKADPITKDISVIFLSAQSDAEDDVRGFEAGAVDYIAKPISPAILQARVAAHLTLKATADYLRDKSVFLANEVARRTQEVTAIQDVMILAMGSLAETRDNETGNHIRRTQLYVRALAEHLRQHPRFAAFLT